MLLVTAPYAGWHTRTKAVTVRFRNNAAVLLEEMFMRRKLLVLAGLLGICALGLDRPATALSTCSAANCKHGGQCICPAGTRGAGTVADCATWSPDCNFL
jgi:hypothetical protein